MSNTGETNHQIYIKEDEILYQYDEILLDKRESVSVMVIAKESGNRFTDRILKYCFHDYLNWTPYDVINKLTPELVSMLKLSPFIHKHIQRPHELYESEMQYVGWHLYPEIRRPTQEELVIKVYSEVLKGVRDRYPKHFFDDADGERRAIICFKVMLNEHVLPESVESLYEMFGNKERGKAVLEKCQLLLPCETLFETPLEYLNETLVSDNIDELWLYYKYKNKEKDK